MFSKGCSFTDDSVMTIAVGEALLAVGPQATVKEIEEAIATNMQDWGGRYPHTGYGGRFRHWLKEKIQNHTEAMEMVQPGECQRQAGFMTRWKEPER